MIAVMCRAPVPDYFCWYLMNNDTTLYAKLSLRRLWPALSGHLFPDTNKKLLYSLEEIRAVVNEDPSCEHNTELLSTLEQLIAAFKDYEKLIESTVADRLKTLPYGNQVFDLSRFESGVKVIKEFAAGLKQLMQKVRAIARSCFAKTGSSAQAKLLLARLNATEQDLNYLLFVEQQYIRPHLVRGTDVP
jgi:hypothetical protein